MPNLPKVQKQLSQRISKIEELAGDIGPGSYLDPTARAIEKECTKLRKIADSLLVKK